MLSQTAEYALRAVLYLAARGETGAVGVEAMAGELGIPPSYLSKTCQVLVRHGVLESVRGRSGGFRLALAPERLRLACVVDPFKDETERRHCLLGREQPPIQLHRLRFGLRRELFLEQPLDALVELLHL